MNNSSTDNMFTSNLTSSPLSAQSWIVDNISSLIASTHDDDFDCTLTNRDDESLSMNNKLNTPPSLRTTGAVHLNEEIEETRGYDHHSPDGIYAGNNSCVASNTSILVNQHYSPPDHFVQQDFIAAYNQILQQQQQQQNLSFMQYTTKNFSYLDTIQQQQQYQQHSEQKRNMRHCLS